MLKTAQIIAARHPQVLSLTVDPALKEQYWGSLQGHPHGYRDADPSDMESQAEYVFAPFRDGQQLTFTSCSLNARIEGWLQALIGTHGPLSTSTVLPGSLLPDADGQVVLAVSHEDCILAIRHLLIKSDCGASPLAPFSIDVAPHIKITDQIGNTSCIVLRIWEEEGVEKKRIRIEAWPWTREDWVEPVRQDATS